jgi:uncharacterized DUF497 family protein
MEDDDFEWDDAKAAQNVLQHPVSFEAARRAFDDPFAVVREDRRKITARIAISCSGWLMIVCSPPRIRSAGRACLSSRPDRRNQGNDDAIMKKPLSTN